MKASGNVRLALAACILALFILPSIMIGWVSEAAAPSLRPVLPTGYALSNLEASQKMLRGFGQNDSWYPMLSALTVVHSARDHARLYEKVFFEQNIKFQYPPTSLLPIDFLKRLGVASYGSLNRLNLFVFLANAAALAWIAAFLFDAKDRQQPPSSRDRFVQIGIAGMAFFAAFFFYPLVIAKLLGQIQLWVNLLFTLTVLAWLLDRRVLAGMLIGLACVLKPQAGIILIWAIAWKEWSVARGILTTAIPILGISLIGYGIHNHFVYLKVLSSLSAHGEAYFANNSVNGLLNRMLGNGEILGFLPHSFPPFNPVVYAGTTAFAVVMLVAMLAPAWRSRRPVTTLDLSVAIICSVIMSPIAWEHHYGVLPPLYLVALRAWLDHRGKSAGGSGFSLGALTLSWVLTATFIPLPNLLADTPYNFLLNYVFFGALILLGLIFWWRPKAPRHSLPLAA